MQSPTLQQEYAAARIAELRDAACHAELVREARESRRPRRPRARVRLALPWR
jgi:hypothetical protein